jgi:hypothetical protein
MSRYDVFEQPDGHVVVGVALDESGNKMTAPPKNIDIESQEERRETGEDVSVDVLTVRRVAAVIFVCSLTTMILWFLLSVVSK